MTLAVAASLLLSCCSPGADAGTSVPPAGETTRDEEGSRWFARANTGYGLFDVVSLSPFASLRSGFRPRMPRSLSEGEWEAGLVQSWAKEFTATSSALVDFEVLRTNLQLAVGLSDSVALEVEVDASERTAGGALGRLIVAFHRAFGIRNYYKDYPADFYRFKATAASHNVSVDVPSDDPQPFESSCVISGDFTLAHGDKNLPAILCSLGVRRDLLPGDLTGGSPVDVSVSLSASKTVGDVFFYLGSSVSWFGHEDFFGLALRPLIWQCLAGIEWHCATPLSVVIGYLLTRGTVAGLPDFDVPTHEISAGVKWEIVPGVLLSLGILENVINPNNAPDFGFHLELTFRW